MQGKKRPVDNFDTKTGSTTNTKRLLATDTLTVVTTTITRRASTKKPPKGNAPQSERQQLHPSEDSSSWPLI
jgi:hypothetical protein